MGCCCLNPIITGNPDDFLTFIYPFVQNSGISNSEKERQKVKAQNALNQFYTVMM